MRRILKYIVRFCFGARPTHKLSEADPFKVAAISRSQKKRITLEHIFRFFVGAPPAPESL